MQFLTDTHCHLNLNIFQEDMAGFLNRAWDAGVQRILIPGINIETSRLAVALAEKHENLYAAVGVHPGDAGSWNNDTLATLRDLAQHPKTAAIGEIGLDYYRDHSPREQQRDIFQQQLELAAEMELPVVIHNRSSFRDIWSDLTAWQDRLVKSSSPLASRPGVLHSFDGDVPTATAVMEKGFFIGISGPVTFKNAREHQGVIANLPLKKILIETDAPYLTPHPFRGRWPNEPAHVALVAEKIAELHSMPAGTIAQRTWENAAQLLNWGAIS